MSTPDRRAHARSRSSGRCRSGGNARCSGWRARASIGLPRPANDDDAGADAADRRAVHWRWPFLGSRRMTAMLRAEGRRSTASGCSG